MLTWPKATSARKFSWFSFACTCYFSSARSKQPASNLLERIDGRHKHGGDGVVKLGVVALHLSLEYLVRYVPKRLQTKVHEHEQRQVIVGTSLLAADASVVFSSNNLWQQTLVNTTHIIILKTKKKRK